MNKPSFITIVEALDQLGDHLMETRDGKTVWLEVGNRFGVWKPVYEDEVWVKGYQFHPYEGAVRGRTY